MACGTTQQKDREDYLAMIVDTQGSTSCGTAVCAVRSQGGANAIANSIDAIVSNPESYEQGEAPPSEGAVCAAVDLLQEAEVSGTHLPAASVSTYYGELNVTWQSENRLLRLITYSDNREPVLYFCTH